MSYDYEKERSTLFSESGMVLVLKMRDNVDKCLEMAGAVGVSGAIQGVTGDSWQMMAVLDYLEERGEIIEVTDTSCRGQDRVFVRGVR